MKLNQLRNEISNLHLRQGLEIISRSPVVTWSFPGQFCYCINEEFVWERFGTMINLSEEIHFNKTQTAFRWDDFTKYFLGVSSQPAIQSKMHLGVFDLATIPAGHIVGSEHAKEYSKMAYEGLFDFLFKVLGFKKENFVVSYFAGKNLSVVGRNQFGKEFFNFDYYFPEDKDSVNFLFTLGLKKNQLVPDSSRDCFLIPHWACGEIAPWGYRHEVNYKTEQGLVDIGTIERLAFEPMVENGKFLGVRPWSKSFIISGIGLERAVMVSEGLSSIQDVENIKSLYSYANKYSNPKLICETLRAYHRIFTDTNGEMRDKRSPGKAFDRRQKYNKLRNILYKLPINEVSEMCKINAEINPWYDELERSIEGAVAEIVAYRPKG
jgi:hypothetical protein